MGEVKCIEPHTGGGRADLCISTPRLHLLLHFPILSSPLPPSSFHLFFPLCSPCLFSSPPLSIHLIPFSFLNMSSCLPSLLSFTLLQSLYIPPFCITFFNLYSYPYLSPLSLSISLLPTLISAASNPTRHPQSYNRTSIY